MSAAGISAWQATERSDLEKIPGIGPQVARRLRAVGVNDATELAGHDAEGLYEAVCASTGRKEDRCLLYVLRCAIYYVTHRQHDIDLLKWWNWQD